LRHLKNDFTKRENNDLGASFREIEQNELFIGIGDQDAVI
jgi:hypothetical protein